jgi:hypothetical protein
MMEVIAFVEENRGCHTDYAGFVVINFGPGIGFLVIFAGESESRDSVVV